MNLTGHTLMAVGTIEAVDKLPVEELVSTVSTINPEYGLIIKSVFQGIIAVVHLWIAIKKLKKEEKKNV